MGLALDVIGQKARFWRRARLLALSWIQVLGERFLSDANGSAMSR
jgi:hypothetical protein